MTTPRRPVVVEYVSQHSIIRVRRGMQWAVTISHAEAVELANALIDMVERKES